MTTFKCPYQRCDWPRCKGDSNHPLCYAEIERIGQEAARVARGTCQPITAASRLNCEQLVERDGEVRVCKNKAAWTVTTRTMHPIEHLCEQHKRKIEKIGIAADLLLIRME